MRGEYNIPMSCTIRNQRKRRDKSLPRPDGRGKYIIPRLINPGIHRIESH
jgi:hypothetical protein